MRQIDFCYDDMMMSKTVIRFRTLKLFSNKLFYFILSIYRLGDMGRKKMHFRIESTIVTLSQWCIVGNYIRVMIWQKIVSRFK